MSLSDFSNALHEMAQRNRDEAEAKARELSEVLPQFQEAVVALSNEDLLEWYDNALHGGYSSPVIMDVLATRKGIIRDEMLRRMTN